MACSLQPQFRLQQPCCHHDPLAWRLRGCSPTCPARGPLCPACGPVSVTPCESSLQPCARYGLSYDSAALDPSCAVEITNGATPCLLLCLLYACCYACCMPAVCLLYGVWPGVGCEYEHADWTAPPLPVAVQALPSARRTAGPARRSRLTAHRCAARRVHASACACTCTCTCVCAHAHVHVHMHACAQRQHIHTCTAYAGMHACMCM